MWTELFVKAGATILTVVAVSGPAAAQVGGAPALPFKPYTITAPDGVRVAVQEWGNPQGPAILLIHGYSQAYLSWAKQYGDAELARKYRIVTYDLRGHGASDKPADKAAYQDSRRWADEVKAVIDGVGLSKPVLVGWSYAGRVVSDYLMVHGDAAISGVNYVDATTNIALNAGAPGGAPSVAMASADLAAGIRSTRDFLRFCFEKQPSAEELDTMAAFNAMTPPYVRTSLFGRPTPYEATLKGLKVPVLVTHGVADRAVNKAVSEYTAATVPGAKTSYYDGVGHSPFWEDAPRFNRELAAFVDAAQR